MFYPFFKSITDRLIDQVAALVDIQWFNEQYSSPSLSPCLAFIEFPETIRVASISKNSSRAEVPICVHILSKIMSDKDGYVPNDQISAHDAVADAVETALREYQLTYNNAPLGKPLQVVGYQVQHKEKGWLVIKIFFNTKEY